MINVFALILWFMVGILTLLVYSNQDGVGKAPYILCLLTLLAYIGVGIIIQ